MTDFLSLNIVAKDGATDTLKGVEKGAQGLRETFQDIGKDARSLTEALKRTERTFNLYIRTFDRAAKAENRYNRARVNNVKAVKQDVNVRRQQTKSLQGFAQGLRVSTSSLGSFTGGLASAGSAGGVLGVAAVGIAAGLKGVSVAADFAAAGVREVFSTMSQATGTAVQFEAAIIRVAATTGDVSKNLEILENRAQRAGAETFFSAREAAGALQELVQAGLSASQASQTLDAALTLAQASGKSTAATADILTNVLSGYNLEATEAGRVTDLIITGFQSANTDAISFGKALQGAVALGRGYGQTLEDIATVQAAVANTGIRGEKAARAYRRALSELSKGLPRTTDTLAKLNVSAKDANGQLRALPDIIKDLNAAGASARDVEQIFGAFAGPALAPLILGNVDALDKLRAKFGDVEGRGKAFTKEIGQTTVGALKALESRAEAVEIALGKRLTPALKGVALVGGEVATSLAKNNEFFEDFRVISVAFVRALEYALPIIGLLASEALRMTTLLVNLTKGVDILADSVLLATAPLLSFSEALQGNFEASLDAVSPERINKIIGDIKGTTDSFIQTRDAARRAGDQIQKSFTDAGQGVRRFRQSLEASNATIAAQNKQLKEAQAVAGTVKVLGIALGAVTDAARDIPGVGQEIGSAFDFIADKANLLKTSAVEAVDTARKRTELLQQANVDLVNSLSDVTKGYSDLALARFKALNGPAPEPTFNDGPLKSLANDQKDTDRTRRTIRDTSKEQAIQLRIAQTKQSVERVLLNLELSKLRINKEAITSKSKALKIQTAEAKARQEIIDLEERRLELLQKQRDESAKAAQEALSFTQAAQQASLEKILNIEEGRARLLQRSESIEKRRLGIQQELATVIQRIRADDDLTDDEKSIAVQNARLDAKAKELAINKKIEDEAKDAFEKRKARTLQSIELQRQLGTAASASLGRAGDLSDLAGAQRIEQLQQGLERLNETRDRLTNSSQDTRFIDRRIEALELERQAEEKNQALIRQRFDLTRQALVQGNEVFAQIRLATAATTSQKEAQIAANAAIGAGVGLAGSLASIFITSAKERAKVEGAINAAASVASFGYYAYSGFTAQNFLQASITHGLAAAKYFAIAGASSGGTSTPGGGGSSTGTPVDLTPRTQGSDATSRQNSRDNQSLVARLLELQTANQGGSNIYLNGTFLESSERTARRIDRQTRRARQTRFVLGEAAG